MPSPPMSFAYRNPFPTTPRSALMALVVILALVKPKRLFVQVSEQMKRFNVHVCSSQCSLEQRPEVFESVGVNVAFCVALRVINHVVYVFISQFVVGLEGVRVNFRAFFDMLA